MFVRAKGLTEIIAKARDILAEDQTFIRWLEDDAESRLRARVRWPGDEHREADLAVTFIHLSGEVIRGGMPERALRLVREWREIHRRTDGKLGTTPGP